MIMTNKLLPVALVAALIGGSVGAVVMHSRSQPATAETQSTTATVPATDAQYQTTASNGQAFVPAPNRVPTRQDSRTVFEPVHLALQELSLAVRVLQSIEMPAVAMRTLLVRGPLPLTLQGRKVVASGKNIVTSSR